MKVRGGRNARETRKQTGRVRFCSRRRLTTALDFFAPLHRHRSRTPLQLESSLWQPLLSRQTKTETRAASIGVFGCNASPMCFDDRADDGKTHSETFLFRGEELLEETLLR